MKIKTMILGVALSLIGSLFGWVSLGVAGEILCSTFPVYLFTKNIIQNQPGMTATLLTASDQGCPHDYVLSPAELDRLAKAKILVINGLGMESSLSRALKVARSDLRIIDTSGGQRPNGASPPMIMPDRKLAYNAFQYHGANPHLFASPSLAPYMINNITEGLVAADPGGEAVYRANAAKFVTELNALETTVREVGQTLGGAKVIVSHSLFEDFSRDLGLEVVGLIEEEDGLAPSAAHLIDLAKLGRQQGVRAILTDPDSDYKLAQMLGAEIKVPVAVIDLLASGPADAPLDYYQKVILTDLDILVKLFGPSSGSAVKNQGSGKATANK